VEEDLSKTAGETTCLHDRSLNNRVARGGEVKEAVGLADVVSRTAEEIGAQSAAGVPAVLRPTEPTHQSGNVGRACPSQPGEES
jgi:hypothetical protein